MRKNLISLCPIWKGLYLAQKNSTRQQRFKAAVPKLYWARPKSELAKRFVTHALNNMIKTTLPNRKIFFLLCQECWNEFRVAWGCWIQNYIIFPKLVLAFKIKAFVILIVGQNGQEPRSFMTSFTKIRNPKPKIFFHWKLKDLLSLLTVTMIIIIVWMIFSSK